MKKTLYFIAISALMLVTFFGGSTAHAANAGQYYMVVMQEQAPKNCTSRHSDLGLGGGVFVAGTSFCEDQAPSMLMIIGALDDSYNTGNYDEEHYGNDHPYEYDSSYDDYDYDYDDEDSYEDEDEYDEDYNDEDNDDDQSDEDEDEDPDYGSHSW